MTANELETATLMDNLYMVKFFSDQPACVETVLRIILGKPDLNVVKAETERQIVSLQSRSAGFDVLAQDAQGKLYNIEIQSKRWNASPQRARFNAAILDSDSLPKGASYDRLPESYVIFIVDGDALGYGLPAYHIDRVIKETGERFLDGSHIIYLDASYNWDNGGLGDLMHDFMCADPGKMRCAPLAERAAYLKRTERGRKEMTTVFEKLVDERVHRESKALAEQIAPEMAREMAEPMAREMAKQMAREMAHEMAREMAREMAEQMTRETTERLAQEIAERAVEQARDQDRTGMVKSLASVGIAHEVIAQACALPLEEVARRLGEPSAHTTE